MGRTNPTYRDALSAIEDRWTPYRRTLRRQDRERFDRLFAYAREHADAAGTRNHRNPLVAALVGIVLEQERRHDTAAAERDDLGDRLDGVDDRLDDLAARLAGIEDRVDGIETQVDALSDADEAAASRLDAIEDRLSELEARVDAAAMDYHLDETALDDRLADAAIDDVGGRPGREAVATIPDRDDQSTPGDEGA